MGTEFSSLDYLLLREQLDIWSDFVKRYATPAAATAYRHVQMAVRAATVLWGAATYGSAGARHLALVDALGDTLIPAAERALSGMRADFALIQQLTTGEPFRHWDYEGPSAHEAAMSFVLSVRRASDIPPLFDAGPIKRNPLFRWRAIFPRICRLQPIDDASMLRSMRLECFATVNFPNLSTADRLRMAAGVKPPRGPKPSPKHDFEVRAVILLRDQPNLSMRRIARMVGCHPSSLSRSQLFQAAMKANRGNVPRGWKDAATGEIDAYET